MRDVAPLNLIQELFTRFCRRLWTLLTLFTIFAFFGFIVVELRSDELGECEVAEDMRRRDVLAALAIISEAVCEVALDECVDGEIGFLFLYFQSIKAFNHALIFIQYFLECLPYFLPIVPNFVR